MPISRAKWPSFRERNISAREILFVLRTRYSPALVAGVVLMLDQVGNIPKHELQDLKVEG